MKSKYIMKILTLSLLIIICISCKSKEFSLIGKWICIEEHGNNGANDFIHKIEDGDVLIFDSNNIVTDKRGIKGTYNLKGDSLQIDLPDIPNFYILRKFKDDFDKISLSPRTSDYNIFCDEGCEFIYEK